jgi:hypothetical protein
MYNGRPWDLTVLFICRSDINTLWLEQRITIWLGKVFYYQRWWHSSDLYGTLVLKSPVSLYLLIFPFFQRQWQIHDNQNTVLIKEHRLSCIYTEFLPQNFVYMQMDPHQIIKIWCLFWIYTSNSGLNAVYFMTLCTLWHFELSGFGSSATEDSVLLGYCTPSLGDQCPTFRTV